MLMMSLRGICGQLKPCLLAEAQYAVDHRGQWPWVVSHSPIHLIRTFRMGAPTLGAFMRSLRSLLDMTSRY